MRLTQSVPDPGSNLTPFEDLQPRSRSQHAAWPEPDAETTVTLQLKMTQRYQTPDPGSACASIPGII